PTTPTASSPSGTRSSTNPIGSQFAPNLVGAQFIVPPSNTLQIGRTHQSKLVGRADELNLLYGMLSETERSAKFKLPGQKRLAAQPFDVQRRPQALLLMGDVGIGKTRLAEEMGREAKRRGWAVAWSRVYAQEGSIPYRLWVEILRKAMSQGRGVGAATYPPGTPMYVPPQMMQRPLIFQPLAALLPELQSILPEVSFQNAQPPEHEQLRLWEAARELLTTISEGTPLLIVLDDLQWSDSSSCELLAYLARRTQGYPILIIGTCRDRELPTDHPLRPLLTDLQREHAMTTMQVELLSDEHIAALIAAMPHLPAPLVPHIRARAAGNPFFAEELARVIDPVRAQNDLDSVQAQFIVPSANANTSHNNSSQTDLDPGAQFIVPPATLDDVIPHLPETITAVLDLRLARLSPACHRLLSKAAVLGGSFPFPIIYAMEHSTLGAGAQNLDEDTVLDLIEEALQSGMLTEEGTGTRITYHFWHPLLVSHLYEGLSAARRASLHRRAADVLRHAHATHQEEAAASITHHHLLGGANDQDIAHYAEMAGDWAYGLPAYPDAEKYYKITVEHIGTVKERDELLRLSYVLERLAESVTIQGKDEDARRFYEQILEVRSQLPPPASTDEHLQEAQINALLWGEIGKTWYDVGNTAKAREYYQRSEQILQGAGVVAGFVWARLRLHESHTYWREGNYGEAYRKAQEARTLFEQAFGQQNQNPKLLSLSTPVRRILRGDPIDLGRTYALLGLIADEAGRCTEALTHLNAALTSYEQHDRQREIAIVCCNLGDVYLRRAEHILAQSALRRSLSLAEKIGEIPLISVIFGNLGVLSMRNGNLIEAEDWFRQSLMLAERMNNPVYMSLWNAALATVLQNRSKFSEATKHLAQGLSVGRSMRISPRIGFALVSLGDMRITQALTISDKQDKTRTHLLKRARSTLQRALGLQELEAETRTKGQLLLAQVEQLMDNAELAQQQAMHTLEQAQGFELAALAARAQRLLGIIYAVRGNQGEAKQQFEQALQMFRKSGMRLDHARTLQQYGMFLIRQDGVEGKEYQRGLGYLQEARQMFKECNASLDLQLVERELSNYARTVTKQK
ncbi:MAG: tetratricopeptide repeat protein, partial [Ktedonobacteraceae bacterium]|nr:tetratricopeptide repeat protein [Ktedonobacteraceae bacterium]